jgi:hypothetical protein
LLSRPASKAAPTLRVEFHAERRCGWPSALIAASPA